MDKIFIGKVTDKQWPDGNVTIKLALNEKDKDLLAQRQGVTTIEVKKSKKGNWYAEIPSFVPDSQQSQRQEAVDDLPF